MDDPKEGGLLTPYWCDWTTYQFCKIILRCVFIFAPIYYHIKVYFSIKMWQSAYYCELPHYHIFPIRINLHGASTMFKSLLRKFILPFLQTESYRKLNSPQRLQIIPNLQFDLIESPQCFS